MAAMLKPSARYNRRAAITEGYRAGRSAMEIIRFFGPEINRLWSFLPCCDKIYGFRTIQWRLLLERTDRENRCDRWKSSSADFGWPRAIVTKISIDCWCKWVNNASNCRGGLSIQIVYIKNTTDALWGCQNKLSCSPWFSFWPPNSSDLNPLDYYVWSVVERVTNKSRHPNVIKERHYWGSIRRHGRL